MSKGLRKITLSWSALLSNRSPAVSPSAAPDQAPANAVGTPMTTFGGHGRYVTSGNRS